MEQLKLQDKVIFITGAAGKLGFAATKLFLSRGAIVVGSDIVPIDKAKESSLRETYGDDRFCFEFIDSSEEQQVKAGMAMIEQKFGRIDGVFHNAYKQAIKPLTELTLEEWNAAIKGSLTSTFLVNKYAVSSMLKSGGGAIVNTSSVLSQKPAVNNAAYGAAKAGINQLTRVIALEYGEQNIRANALLPGDFKSKEYLEAMDEEELKAFSNKFLLNRTGKPEEMAEMAAFLLSDASSYTTGSLMTVDGGFTL